MSTPPRMLEQGPAADPRLKPHVRLAAAREAALLEQRQPSEGSAAAIDRTAALADGADAAGEQASAGKTRVWGQRSLAKRAAGAKRTHRNRSVLRSSPCTSAMRTSQPGTTSLKHPACRSGHHCRNSATRSMLTALVPRAKTCCTRRFPAVALQWFQLLLADCDAPRHGVDLFGRDALLLGRQVPRSGLSAGQ